jgi:hypothetical protein
MVRQLINDELESIWKEVVVAESRCYPGIFLEELRKTTKSLIHISRFLAEIRIQLFPSTSLGHTAWPSCLVKLNVM